MYGENSHDNATPLNTGDFVDVKIDFESNRIFYFRNLQLEGFIAPSQSSFKEGKLYPCVSLGFESSVRFANESNSFGDLT